VRRLRILGAFFLGHSEKQPPLFERMGELLDSAELRLDPILFFEDGLRRLGLIPEAGLGRLLEQFLLAGG
jgi:hypothetical protein